jgi:hypothetical protein
MEPKYVTFDQAKWLKEKGFDYHKIFQDFADYYDYYDSQVQGRLHVSDFSEDKYPDDKWIAVPEQWQVVEWLRVNHGVWVYVKLGYGHEFVIQKALVPFEIIYADGTFNSPQEAYSAAFDYILKELI